VTRRILGLQVAALALFALLAAQLARMQLLDPEVPPGYEPGTEARVVRAESPRGLIVDRGGRVIARNVPRFDLVVVPGDLPRDQAARARALVDLSHATGVPLGTLAGEVDRGLRSVDPLAARPLISGLSREQAIAMRAATAGIAGVDVRVTPGRAYEGGMLLAHILGHVGAIDEEELASYLARGYAMNGAVGRDGVERIYEAALRGEPGRRLVLTAAAGREIATLGELPGRAGATLMLSVDLELQRATAAALQRGIATGLARPDQGPSPVPAGAAVLLDARTGEVLALVSSPAYDANLFAGGGDAGQIASALVDPARPLVDRTYMEAHPPGSTFKPLVALAALQEGVATPQTRIASYGALYVQDVYNPSVTYVFGDWAAHGTLDLYGGMARSSDVYFYYLAGGYWQGRREVFRGLGPDRVAAYARSAGLGTPTGIDLPGEAPGLVPDPAWKLKATGDTWFLGDTYTFGIGQGYLTTTPLQMAVFTAAIANGGEVLVPRVVRGIERDGRIESTGRRVRGTLPVSPDTVRIVRETMRASTGPTGTASSGQPAGMTIGGKTGTAEFGTPDAKGTYPTHGWYIGFAPYDRPEVAVAVYLHHGVGAMDAGPVAREILEAYFGSRPSPSARSAP